MAWSNIGGFQSGAARRALDGGAPRANSRAMFVNFFQEIKSAGVPTILQKRTICFGAQHV
jgi:hypothetical protein